MDKKKGGRPHGTIDQGIKFKKLLIHFERTLAAGLTERDIESMADKLNTKARGGDIDAIKFIYSFKDRTKRKEKKNE